MFKIGEFSKLTQVSIRMLRYYDQTGLLKPAKIDPWTSYRFYSIHQIPVLEKIIYLRDSGFNVAEIAVALAEKDELAMAEMLNTKLEEIKSNIRLEQEKIKKIEMARKEILAGKDQLHYHISMKSVPGYQVLSLRKVIPAYDREGELWAALAGFMKENHIQFTGIFSICHDAEYKETDVDVEVCAMVQEMGENTDGFTYRETQPISIVAATMVQGDFSNIAGAYKAFAQWLQRNSDYKMTNETRQIVHRGPWSEKKPENYLIELQLPLEKCGET